MPVQVAKSPSTPGWETVGGPAQQRQRQPLPPAPKDAEIIEPEHIRTLHATPSAPGCFAAAAQPPLCAHNAVCAPAGLRPITRERLPPRCRRDLAYTGSGTRLAGRCT